jgi:hypothetical protein
VQIRSHIRGYRRTPSATEKVGARPKKKKITWHDLFHRDLEDAIEVSRTKNGRAYVTERGTSRLAKNCDGRPGSGMERQDKGKDGQR